MGGAIVQQQFAVEFTVNNQMCEQCQRIEAKDFWRACVQVRQKVCFICFLICMLYAFVDFEASHDSNLIIY